MSLKAGDSVKWIHPENGEEYYFHVVDVESWGCQHRITLKDGTRVDIWDHEIAPDKPVEIHEDQINPEPNDDPVRYGPLMR